MPRSPTSLLGIDLNLLVIFEALMAERHLSRAAERVGLSQPGVSHALGRLRQMLGDPLFERSRGGMEPTPRALALAEPVGACLARLERVLIGEAGFDPGKACREFCMTISDASAAGLLPPLLAHLRKEAPEVSIRILPTQSSEGLEYVMTGEADLGVGIYPNLPRTLFSALLTSTRLVCIADADNPRLAKGLDAAAFVELPHIAVASGEDRGANIDAIIGTMGLERRIILTVPHFMLAPKIVAGSDFISVLPEAFVRIISTQGLRAYPLPVETQIVSARMIWRERNDQDDAQRWFRHLVQCYF